MVRPPANSLASHVKIRWNNVYLEPLRVLGRRNIDLRIAPPRLDLDFSDIFWLHNVILIGKVDGRKSFDAGGRFCLAIASGLTRARKKHRQFAGATFCKIKLC